MLRHQNKKASLSFISPDSEKDPVKQALNLLTQSRLHRSWTVGDISRLIIPPIECNQCVFAYADHSLMGFCTWGCFSEDIAQHFISGTRALKPCDWTSGENLWIVDAIAPYGQVHPLSRGVYTLLKERFPWASSFKAIRHYLNRHRRVVTCPLRSPPPVEILHE